MATRKRPSAPKSATAKPSTSRTAKRTTRKPKSAASSQVPDAPPYREQAKCLMHFQTADWGESRNLRLAADAAVCAEGVLISLNGGHSPDKPLIRLDAALSLLPASWMFTTATPPTLSELSRTACWIRWRGMEGEAPHVAARYALHIRNRVLAAYAKHARQSGLGDHRYLNLEVRTNEMNGPTLLNAGVLQRAADHACAAADALGIDLYPTDPIFILLPKLVMHDAMTQKMPGDTLAVGEKIDRRVWNGQERSAPQSPPSEAAMSTPLSEKEERMLLYMTEFPIRRQTREQVVKKGPFKNKDTAGDLLNSLEAKGLLDRNSGPRRGWAPTEDGIARGKALRDADPARR